MDNINLIKQIKKHFSTKTFEVAVFWRASPYSPDQIKDRTKKREISDWRMLGVFFYAVNNYKTKTICDVFNYKSHTSVGHCLKILNENLKSKSPNFIKMLVHRMNQIIESSGENENLLELTDVENFVGAYFKKSHYQQKLTNSIYAMMSMAYRFPNGHFRKNELGLKTVYISGRISGMEKKAFELFEAAELALIEKGFRVINPMKLPHQHDLTWESYMKEDIAALCQCDYIYFISNWMESRGAQIENMISDLVNIPTLDIDQEKNDQQIESLNDFNLKSH
jgi:hypothetical protein